MAEATENVVERVDLPTPMPAYTTTGNDKDEKPAANTDAVQSNQSKEEAVSLIKEDIGVEEPDSVAESEKVLITICSADRKKKKAFMSIPKRNHVIEKAHKYGLNGSTLVLEQNGCEICEDEVLVLFAREKSLLMILAENEEYVAIAQPLSALKRDKLNVNSSPNSIYFVDNSLASNANDSTLSNDETISMTSIAPSGSTSTVKSSPQFVDFVIPWHKVPDHIMKSLREKSSLGKRMNTLANLLVDELRERCAHIPTRVFRQIAQQAAEKYPDSLLEKDREGQLISTVPQSLISKMINRNNTLTRPASSKRSGTGIFEVHISSKKSRKSASSSGNSSIAKISNGVNVNETLNWTLEEKKKELISFHKGLTTADGGIITEHMKQCFPLQRAFFNNSEKIPDISLIEENWPYIFNKEILYQHFELLLSIDPRNLARYLSAEKLRLFRFFKNSKNKKISALEETTDMNVVRGLAYYFNEDPDFIFKYFEHNTNSELLKGSNPTNAPWVALVKKENSNNENDFDAHIFIEGKTMVNCSSNESSFTDIITQLICYYYTFNMMYPKEATQTLEFMVIYFLKNAAERSSKKIATGNNKYNQLIAKIAQSNC